MIPTPQSTQIVNALANADRGMIDALSRETLVGEGMTFEIPQVTAVPTVANIAENGAVTDSSLSATFLSVPVQSFKGRAISTVELIDRSRPEYLTALLANLEFAYAKVTDEFAVGTIAAAGQQTGVNANTATGFLAYTSQAAGAVYGFITRICSQHRCFTRTMDKHHGLQRQRRTTIQCSSAIKRSWKCTR
jgi:hypothetical protein